MASSKFALSGQHTPDQTCALLCSLWGRKQRIHFCLKILEVTVSMGLASFEDTGEVFLKRENRPKSGDVMESVEARRSSELQRRSLRLLLPRITDTSRLSYSHQIILIFCSSADCFSLEMGFSVLC